MSHIWYVTFEVQKRGTLPRARHPRLTNRFATQAEAKEFAREKLNQGLVVTAGTLNPHSPKQIIPPGAIWTWLGSGQGQQAGSLTTPKASNPNLKNNATPRWRLPPFSERLVWRTTLANYAVHQPFERRLVDLVELTEQRDASIVEDIERRMCSNAAENVSICAGSLISTRCKRQVAAARGQFLRQRGRCRSPARSLPRRLRKSQSFSTSKRAGSARARRACNLENIPRPTDAVSSPGAYTLIRRVRQVAPLVFRFQTAVRARASL